MLRGSLQVALLVMPGGLSAVHRLRRLQRGLGHDSGPIVAGQGMMLAGADFVAS